MESFERGLLTLDDTDGIELRFGNAEALLPCLEAIAYRRGRLGALLAGGSRMAAAELGGGSDSWAMHVKGLEMPGYEPRSLKTMALALAVSTRGACHNRSSAYEADFSNAVNRFEADAERGRITADGEDFSAVSRLAHLVQVPPQGVRRLLGRIGGRPEPDNGMGCYARRA